MHSRIVSEGYEERVAETTGVSECAHFVSRPRQAREPFHDVKPFRDSQGDSPRTCAHSQSAFDLRTCRQLNNKLNTQTILVMASDEEQLNLECDNRLNPGDLAMELPIYLCCLCPCWTCMVPKVRGVPAEATLMPKVEQLQLLEAMKGDWKVLPMEGITANMTVYEKATIDGSRIILSGGSHRFKGRTVANQTQVPLKQQSSKPFSNRTRCHRQRIHVFLLTRTAGSIPQVLAHAERRDLSRSHGIDRGNARL
jgi:hypothetical protein